MKKVMLKPGKYLYKISCDSDLNLVCSLCKKHFKTGDLAQRVFGKFAHWNCLQVQYQEGSDESR